jgi:peptidoglycan/LPS O-acetylase OafA/YrhL
MPMLWLAIVLFLALAIAILRGGRLINLGDIELKVWWLLLVALGLQFGTRWLADETWSETVGVIMVLVSFALLMILVMLNRSKPGMWIVGLGVLMNFTVIALNGGMPVLAGAAEVASGFTVAEPDISGSFKYVLLDESSRLTFFADVIPLRLAGIGEVISLGDIFLALGLGVFLEQELRRPRRWFKHGASAQPGSASRR